MPHRSKKKSIEDGDIEEITDKNLAVSLSLEEDEDSSTIAEEVDNENHETWSNQLEFFFSILGYAVDLANLWRFPYVCYTNGGGAFLIPYFLVLITSACPMFYLELLLGQTLQKGAIGVWKVFPVLQGVGMCQVLVCYAISFYYITIMAWCLYFVIVSFNDILPWSYCSELLGNTPRCINLTYYTELRQSNANIDPSNYSLASTEYFERVMLRIQDSPGIDQIGPLRWQITACTVILYTFLYFVLRKGVRGSGKVVFVTALIPYAFLAILLINALTLKGSAAGIAYLFKPQFDRLSDINVWANAAIQIFFSSGAGLGVHIAYAAHNPRKYNCFRDCVVVSAMNAFSSLFAGVTVFAYLGYMAYFTDSKVNEVVSEGPGLVFQVYPFAISTLPAPAFWSMTFFLLIISLGIDSLVGGFECVITGVTDIIPKKIVDHKYYRPVITLTSVVSCCLVSFLNTARGGMYVFSFMDRFIAGTSLLVGSLFEIIGFAWLYGLDKLCDDFQNLSGACPGIYWRICWKFITPITLTAMVITNFIDPPPLRYYYGTTHPEFLTDSSVTVEATLHGTSQHYDYPRWAYILGWVVTFIPISLIPIWAIYYLIRHKPSCKKLTWKRVFSIGPLDFYPFTKRDVDNFDYDADQRSLPELNRDSLKKSSNHIDPV